MSNKTRNLACTFCRKRKRKCDGGNPCERCKLYNKNGQCEYPSDDHDKRKWKYDSCYVDFLELKTDILEQFASDLIKSDPAQAEATNSKLLCDLPSLPTSLTNASSQVNSALKNLADESHAIDELINTAWRVRQNDKGKTEFYGPISGRQYIMEDSDEEENDVNLINNIDILNSSDVLRNYLFDLFHQHFGKFFYISNLSLETIKTWDFPSSDITQQFLLCTIFAYGSIYSNHYKQASLTYLQEAETLALNACRSINENVIHGLLILSCYQLGMGFDSNSWLFNAMATSMTQYMGLHLANDGESNSDSQLVSLYPTKQAAFWSVVMQDRIITTVLGRGCRIQHSIISAPFYTPRQLQGGPHYLEELAFTFHSRLWFIHDRSMGQIYSFKEIYLHNSHRYNLILQGVEALKVTYDSLPPQIRLTSTTTNPEILMLHLSYYVICFLLHRSSLKQSPLNVMEVLVLQCNNASKLIDRFDKIEGFDKAPYFASYLILTFATFDLFLLTNKDDTLKPAALSRLSISINALLNFSKVWKRGIKDIQVLASMAKKWSLDIGILNVASNQVSEASVGFEDFEHEDVNSDAYGYSFSGVYESLWV